MSRLEDTLLAQIADAGLPEPVREYRFAPPRRWRFDFAWPDRLLAVECEGGTWANGRHNRGAGYANDCEKYNAATLAGWRVLRFESEWITHGAALSEIRKALEKIEKVGE